MTSTETKDPKIGLTTIDTSDELVTSADPNHPANLIPELCKAFYHLGWVTGTGGGISIRDDEKVYIAPSGVQKERILPSHIFVLPWPQSEPPLASTADQRTFLRRPTLPLKESACTPLFWAAFDIRNAYACIHTHSQHAVMATLLWKGKEFRCRKLEMIKGVRWAGVDRAMTYEDELVVPIIENTPEEEDLRHTMAQAIKDYPKAAAILVRRHGVYVWGPSWESAKTQAECLDYLFELAVKMRLAGIDTDAE